jgi:hypothetical protein
VLQARARTSRWKFVGAGEDPKDVDGRLPVQAGLKRSVAQEGVDDGSGVDPAFMFGGLPELSEFLVGASAASEHLGEVGGALVQSHDIPSVESERPSGVGLVEGLLEPWALGQGDRLVVAGDGQVAELLDDGPLVANRREDGLVWTRRPFGRCMRVRRARCPAGATTRPDRAEAIEGPGVRPGGSFTHPR